MGNLVSAVIVFHTFSNSAVLEMHLLIPEIACGISGVASASSPSRPPQPGTYRIICHKESK